MVKSFLVSMFAVFLFTLGAAGAWFYIQMMPAEEESEDAVPVAAQPKLEANPIPKFSDSGSVLPAVLRGPALEPDELFRLQTAAAAKDAQLEKQQERLRERELRIRAADADTRAAQREVEGALAEVRNVMDASEKLLGEIQLAVEELKTQTATMEKKQEDLKALEDQVGAGAAANVKTFAEYMQSMPPADAANAIKEMINDGKIDFAIQLLRDMEPRNVSKILAEIGDPPLVAEIASRYPLAPQFR